MRVYLVGYMASGKSSLGRQLAKMLGFAFHDLDTMFEDRYRIGIADFFDRYDEEAFRSLEQKILIESTALSNAVIATGGGTPCFFDNMGIIRESGVSVYLKWPAGLLAERLKRVRKKRPLLAGIPPEDLEGFITRHLLDREVYYSQARFIIDGARPNIPQLAEVIRKTASEH